MKRGHRKRKKNFFEAQKRCEYMQSLIGVVDKNEGKDNNTFENSKTMLV